MKLFLHIGTEKTGSSYLQTLLALNREQLISKKIFYPNAGKREMDMLSGKISPGNGKELALLLKDENYNGVKKLLQGHMKNAAKKNCASILLSNENLLEYISHESVYENLIKSCDEIQFEWSKLLLVLRDPVDQALSLYKHRTKNGKALAINSWLKSGYHLPDILDRFLSINNNKVNHSVRKYSTKKGELEKIMFVDWLQIQMPKVALQKKVNPSLTLSELYFLKKLNEKNNEYVSPFYDLMLSIPSSEKSRDIDLTEYYKKTIANSLCNLSPIWEKCNDHLEAHEKLTLPVKATSEICEIKKLSFSSHQVDVITSFFLDPKMNQRKLNKLFNKVSRKIFNVFKKA